MKKVVLLFTLVGLCIGVVLLRRTFIFNREPESVRLSEQVVGVPDPESGLQYNLDFPAPQWALGDWWEIDYQNYITATQVRKQPLGYELKEGWGRAQRWRYEIAGEEVVRGSICFVVDITSTVSGSIYRLWHRKSDRMAMRLLVDSRYNEQMKKMHPEDKSRFPARISELEMLQPFRFHLNLPLGMPLFGQARTGDTIQTLKNIERSAVLKMTHEGIRKRVLKRPKARMVKIIIDSEAGGNPDSQIWIENIPWCVFGWFKNNGRGGEQARYWLVDFGNNSVESGDQNDEK